jgi:hypothetical protein
MAYDETPKKKIEIREGDLKDYPDHDELILKAGDSGSYCERTDMNEEIVGYLGMDDIDRIRRKNLKHRTR